MDDTSVPAGLDQRELPSLRKPNCACAQPDHRGHGPRYLWTRTVAGRGTKGRQLSAAEVDKVRAELANYWPPTPRRGRSASPTRSPTGSC